MKWYFLLGLAVGAFAGGWAVGGAYGWHSGSLHAYQQWKADKTSWEAMVSDRDALLKDARQARETAARDLEAGKGRMALLAAEAELEKERSALSENRVKNFEKEVERYRKQEEENGRRIRELEKQAALAGPPR